MNPRRKTRTVKIGSVKIGSGHPVAIQSMVKVSARQTEAAIRQIDRLQCAGCEIVRIAVEDLKDARALRRIRRRIHVPLVADIHFDYRLALVAIEAGADKIRLNPGNIYRQSEVVSVIAAAKEAKIPIRIGANSGSLRVQGRNAAKALVASVQSYLKIFKKMRFQDLVISLKGSDIQETVRAYQHMAQVCDYPLHVGVTATGLPLDGVVKSSLGIGVLLFEGIGDTIRVSLLGEPEEEVAVARLLLSSLKLRVFGPQFICCPTCGRCEVDLLKISRSVEADISRWSPKQQDRLKGQSIALMGCVVNGPGEAREADAGIAFSRHKAVLFRKGRIIKTVPLAQGRKAILGLLKTI